MPALDDLIAEFPLDSHLRMRNAADGPLTRLLSGGVTPPIRRRIDRAAARWLELVLLALDAEDSLEQAGAAAIKENLAELFVAQALRAWMVAAGDAGLRAVVAC
jgi:hypothetical protein